MKKPLLIGAGAAIAVMMIAGDGFAIAMWVASHHKRQPEAGAEVVKARAGKYAGPVYFAKLSKFVVSLPHNSDGGGGGYIQVGFSFSTNNKKAVESFNKLLPIIKADLLADLMRNGPKLAAAQPGRGRKKVVDGTLAIVNNVLRQEDPALRNDLFQGAYLTDFVAQ